MNGNGCWPIPFVRGGSRHWYGYYQYGVTLVYAGKMAQAEAAAALWVQAVTMLPKRNIAKEALRALHKAGKPQEVIRLYGRLPPGVRAW